MVEEVAKRRLAGKLRLAAERRLVARAEADGERCNLNLKAIVNPSRCPILAGGAAKIGGEADAVAKLAS